MYDAIFKVVIFGDAGCGKTTLRKRFITNKFVSNSQQTIGVDFETKLLEIDGKVVKLLIWDFAGEERFRFMFPQYIYGAMGGILMYDITNYASFSHISDWLSVINETRERFPIILLGAKLDLDSFREISPKEGHKVVKSMDLKKFFECSSKTGENVEESFATLTKMMLNKMSIKQASEEHTRNILEALEKRFA
ncbi:MAG: GTP-binding protein [Promethearchaeota archaeon]|nr:MAG: GTP-binding protein [Candidatus Lokiarchaeota archaeon]